MTGHFGQYTIPSTTIGCGIIMDMVVILDLGYIDPGSGSLVIQAVVGAVLGLGYTVRHRIYALVSRFQSKKVEPQPEIDEQAS